MDRASTTATVRRGFVYGAAVLGISNLLCRVIGFLFKVPLANLIGREGMGYFGLAYQLFGVISVIATSGLPVTLSKMVAETRAGDRQSAITTLRAATGVFTAVGCAGSAVLLLFARPIVNAAGNPDAYWPVMALAPSVLFVSLESAYRGYFQGLSDMAPTAVSQFIEALCKLFLGFGFAYVLLQRGYPVYISAAGAILGITIGTLCATGFLSYRVGRAKRAQPSSARKPDRRLARRLIMTALPITAGALLFSLANTIDAFLIVNRLGDAGFDAEAATGLYGAYTGYAMTLYTLPNALTSAVSMSVIPAVAAANASGGRGQVFARYTASNALRVTAVIAFPMAFMFFLLPGPLLSLLFSRQADIAIAAPLLRGLAFAGVFAAFASLSAAILQAIGNLTLPILSMAVGGIIKIAANYILVADPRLNINGAPIGTLLAFAVIMITNVAALIHRLGGVGQLSEIVIKPLCAAGIMGFGAFAAYLLLGRVVSGRMQTVLCCLFAVVLYAVLIKILHIITENDTKFMPKQLKRLLKIVHFV